MDNKTIAKRYLDWFAYNYDEIYNRLRAFCNNKHYTFDEDIFQDCIIKIHNKIIRNGMNDSTDNGFNNYTFLTFKQNLQREKQYSRNNKRDYNITNLSGLYEKYQNSQIALVEKLKRDLFTDFAAIYILLKVEENFSAEELYLFKLKTFDKDMTYKKLAEKTNIKGCRQKVINVKNWLKENVTKDEIKKAFDKKYGNLIC